MTDIAIINRSTAATDMEIAAMLPGFQAQIDNDFYPFWGVRADLHFLRANDNVPAGAWQCPALDYSDQPGDLGYHVNANGVPFGKWFAAEDKRDGISMSVTGSHELLEMLADPTAAILIPRGDITYIREVADPVESDADGYMSKGVLVSNFVTPRYYGLAGPNDPRTDFRNLLNGAVLPTLRPGGYDLFAQAGQWHSTMARHADGSFGKRALRHHGRSWFRAAVAPP